MDMEIALRGIPDLKVNHFTPDNTLAWGKFKGSNVVIRQLFGVGKLHGALTMGGNVKYYDSDKFRGPVCVLAKSKTDSSLLVFYFEHGNIVEDFDEHDLTPDGYECYGMTVFSMFVSDYIDVKDISFTVLSTLYVPFVSGPNNSAIPVLWKVSEDAVDQYRLNTYKIYELSRLGRIDGEFVRKLMQGIETQFPSVDLDTDRDSRYAYLCIEDTHGNNTYYGYNRNHVAYNGAINNYKALAPMLLYLLRCVSPWVKKENLTDYILGDTDISEPVIEYSEKPDDPLGIWEAGGQLLTRQLAESHKVNVEESKVKGSDNPLIRAAQKADTKIK
jgi:hypothetical protein